MSSIRQHATSFDAWHRPRPCCGCSVALFTVNGVFDGWIDARKIAFPGEPDREADCVARFVRREGDAPAVAVIVEFLSRPRSDVLERLLEYQLVLRRTIPLQHDPLVRYDTFGVLVSLTGSQPGNWKMVPLDADGANLSLSVRAVALETIPLHELLTEVADQEVPPVALAFAPLMADADHPQHLQMWAELVGKLESPTERSAIGFLAKIFATLADRQGYWHPLLENGNMERIDFLVEREDKAEARAFRQAISMALRERFGGELPPEVANALMEQPDKHILQAWLRTALTLPSLESFRSPIGRP